VVKKIAVIPAEESSRHSGGRKQPSFRRKKAVVIPAEAGIQPSSMTPGFLLSQE
jgi:hypothetical protein